MLSGSIILWSPDFPPASTPRKMNLYRVIIIFFDPHLLYKLRSQKIMAPCLNPFYGEYHHRRSSSQPKLIIAELCRHREQNIFYFMCFALRGDPAFN